MQIDYRNVKDFKEKDLEELFLSVGWSSGNHPEKLVLAMKKYASVYSAWHNQKLVGLISTMDDGIMTAYTHYLLVNPSYQGKGIGRRLINMTKEHYKDYTTLILISYNKEVDFYKHCGFEEGQDKTPMFISSLEVL